MQRRAFAALLSLSLALLSFAACSHRATTNECVPCAGQSDCEPGLECTDGACVRPCTASKDCPSGLGCAPLVNGEPKRYCACTGDDLDAGSD